MGESTSGPEWISAAEFHRAQGVSDWRVTGTGPQTVFTATSLAHAANLTAPIIAAAERFGILPDIDVRPEGVVVRIPYRNPEGIPAAAAEFAATVSRAAAELLLTADPSLAQSIGIYVAHIPLTGSWRIEESLSCGATSLLVEEGELRIDGLRDFEGVVVRLTPR